MLNARIWRHEKYQLETTRDSHERGERKVEYLLSDEGNKENLHLIKSEKKVGKRVNVNLY